MSNLLKHAERELSLIGYDGKDEYNNMAKAAIMELLATFANQRHSGFSASYVTDIFNKLARFETLSPLTGENNEWNDVTEMSGDRKTLFQNNRNSAVFKDDTGCYYINACLWVEDNGNTYANKKSRGYIKSFPFTPKTFYVKVDKVDKDNNILDTEEYNKAKEYYNNL
jgi:hypothetical protein